MGVNSLAIRTLVERSIRFSMPLHLPRLEGHDAPLEKNGPDLTGDGPDTMRNAIASMITTLSTQLRHSLARARGKEMAQHTQLQIHTDVELYFCDPQSRRKRGSNENTNLPSINTSIRAWISADSVTRISRRWPTYSTPDQEKHSDGKRSLRHSTSVCSSSRKWMLRQELEPGYY